MARNDLHALDQKHRSGSHSRMKVSRRHQPIIQCGGTSFWASNRFCPPTRVGCRLPCGDIDSGGENVDYRSLVHDAAYSLLVHSCSFFLFLVIFDLIIKTRQRQGELHRKWTPVQGWMLNGVVSGRFTLVPWSRCPHWVACNGQAVRNCRHLS